MYFGVISISPLFQGYKNTTGPFPLKEDFLRQTEKYFPVYFHEEFAAHWDEGGRISEIKLVITHPKVQTLDALENSYVPPFKKMAGRVPGKPSNYTSEAGLSSSLLGPVPNFLIS